VEELILELEPDRVDLVAVEQVHHLLELLVAML
jgi:hypothetical protein